MITPYVLGLICLRIGLIMKRTERESVSTYKSRIFYSFLFDLWLIFFLTRIFFQNFYTRKKKNFAVVHIPVWGDYEEIFQFFLQRNFLSDSNQNFAKKEGVHLLFSCTSSHKKLIQNHSGFQKLKASYSISFNLVSSRLFEFSKKSVLPEISLYFILGALQSVALSYSKKMSSALFPFYADILIDKEFFQKVHDISSKGFDCVLTNCFRSSKDGIKLSLTGDYTKPLELSAQEIVDLQCHHLHDISKGRIISTNKFCSITNQLIFLESDSLIVKSFTWTPIFISKTLVKRWKKIFFTPIDSNTTFLVNKFKEKLFFVEDPRSLGICELSGEKPAEKKILIDEERPLEEIIYEVFKETKKEDLFFFSKQAKFTPTSKLNLEYEEVNVKELENNFFKIFERQKQ